jgi:hypothetical protein
MAGEGCKQAPPQPVWCYFLILIDLEARTTLA